MLSLLVATPDYTWHAHAGLEAHHTHSGLVGLHGASRRASLLGFWQACILLGLQAVSEATVCEFGTMSMYHVANYDSFAAARSAEIELGTRML
jgi:hypothetical protein